ncbi:unnamed protein product [Psylliodes chrysocephalus]|uniref:Uncharacterized protein n=1 Tax=Psylliodes chrysocephalus TaxID=3402493 RepID=A0A9P0GDX7_9CUCU|nr:unnamed protein product [Psylliodes chrysocephala]
MDVGFLIYLVAVLGFLLLLGALIRIRFKNQKKNEGNAISGERTRHASRAGRTHQQEDIYNISSRVQDQWPTHDAHLSIDHISILNQMNKSMYNDAPPSYDEVMKTAIQTNGEASTPTAVIVEAPKAISTTTSLRQQ